MSQVIVATSTTTPPVTGMCSGVSLMTMTAKMALSPLSQTTASWHDVVLPPLLIPRDIMKGSVGLTTILQQQQPESHMPSQAYVNYAMGPPKVSFSFKVEPPTDSCVVGVCYGICFLVPIWLSCLLMEV